MKIEPVPFLLGRDLQRLGENFSLNWVKQVGTAANGIFIPYFEKR